MDVLCHLWLPLSKPPTLAKSQVLRAEVSLGFALGLGSQPSAVQGLLSAPSSVPRSRRWHCAPLEVQGHSPSVMAWNPGDVRRHGSAEHLRAGNLWPSPHRLGAEGALADNCRPWLSCPV